MRRAARRPVLAWNVAGRSDVGETLFCSLLPATSFLFARHPGRRVWRWSCSPSLDVPACWAPGGLPPAPAHCACFWGADCAARGVAACRADPHGAHEFAHARCGRPWRGPRAPATLCCAHASRAATAGRGALASLHPPCWRPEPAQRDRWVTGCAAPPHFAGGGFAPHGTRRCCFEGGAPALFGPWPYSPAWGRSSPPWHGPWGTF